MNTEEICKKAVANGEYNSMANCLDKMHGVKGGKRRHSSKRKSHKKHHSRKSHKRVHKRRHTRKSHKRVHKRRHTRKH
jgi:hypothetical protein